jgi:hypothetical protein
MMLLAARGSGALSANIVARLAPVVVLRGFIASQHGIKQRFRN